MLLSFRYHSLSLAAGLILAATSLPSLAQEPASQLAASQPQIDAPRPQIAAASSFVPLDPSSSQTQAPAQSGPQQATSSSQSSSNSSPQQADTQKSEHEKAEEQLKQQETQRVAGVMATFNTTTNRDALPLSPDQKFRLFFKSAFDPWPFGLSAVVAGINQADDADEEWGQGMQGYAKRFGAAYSDYFIGNFFGNAVLPSVLHEDPRYFQMGTGKPMKRFLWAAASTVWCKRDKGGWGPNYANVGGNMIGSAIARLYYPASERTVGDTITDGFTVSAEGVVGAEVIEFWPDLVRRHQRKVAEKKARAEAAAEQKTQAPPPAGSQN